MKAMVLNEYNFLIALFVYMKLWTYNVEVMDIQCGSYGHTMWKLWTYNVEVMDIQCGSYGHTMWKLWTYNVEVRQYNVEVRQYKLCY